MNTNSTLSEFTDSIIALLHVKELEDEIIQKSDIYAFAASDEFYVKEVSDPHMEGATWAGADTVVTNNKSDSLKDWLARSQSHNAIVTEFSFELGWLIYKLKNIYSKKIDFQTKYFFYSDLIDAAKRYEKIFKLNQDAKGMLLFVLMESKKYL